MAKTSIYIMNRTKLSLRNGFTLIEITIVMLIIGIFMTVSFTVFYKMFQTSPLENAKNIVESALSVASSTSTSRHVICFIKLKNLTDGKGVMEVYEDFNEDGMLNENMGESRGDRLVEDGTFSLPNDVLFYKSIIKDKKMTMGFPEMIAVYPDAHCEFQGEFSPIERSFYRKNFNPERGQRLLISDIILSTSNGKYYSCLDIDPASSGIVGSEFVKTE